MSSLRSLLVHLDASPRSAVRLRLAGSVARAQGAELVALYAVMPAVLTQPFAVSEAALSVVPALQQLDDDLRAAARARFDAAASRAGVPMRWAESGTEAVIGTVVEHALVSDLLLLGQHDPADPQARGVPPDFVESVLIGSGKPALVVPWAGEVEAVARDVLIAWKPGPQAARAVTAALPLLRNARQVHLACPPHTEGPAGSAALTAWLARHGVAARIDRHLSDDAQVGESLLSLAADVGADLLVMGCYGHARARELVLGGASRTILRSMTLPVLMSH